MGGVGSHPLEGACIGRPSLCTGHRQYPERDARKHPPKGGLVGMKPRRYQYHCS